MRTAQGPFPMETTYTWQPASDRSTKMTLRNRSEPAGFPRLAAPWWPSPSSKPTARTSASSAPSSRPG